MHKGTAELTRDGDTDIPTLATPRLLLRGWLESDVDPYVEVCQSPRVMGYTGTGRTLTRGEIIERLSRIDPYWQQHGFGMFSVVEQESGSFIGLCGYSTPSYAPQIMPATEIGGRFHDSRWNQGFATEAAAAILDWGFATHNFTEIVAIVQRPNLWASHVARRLGMLEGVSLGIGPSNVPSTLFRLSSERWHDASPR